MNQMDSELRSLLSKYNENQKPTNNLPGDSLQEEEKKEKLFSDDIYKHPSRSQDEEYSTKEFESDSKDEVEYSYFGGFPIRKQREEDDQPHLSTELCGRWCQQCWRGRGPPRRRRPRRGGPRNGGPGGPPGPPPGPPGPPPGQPGPPGPPPRPGGLRVMLAGIQNQLNQMQNTLLLHTNLLQNQQNQMNNISDFITDNLV